MSPDVYFARIITAIFIAACVPVACLLALCVDLTYRTITREGGTTATMETRCLP